jgi:hypothetical protein
MEHARRHIGKAFQPRLGRREHVSDFDVSTNSPLPSKTKLSQLISSPFQSLWIRYQHLELRRLSYNSFKFGSNLVSKTRQIYSQGALSDHVECESATRRLVELTKQITNSLTDLGSLGALSLDSQALQKICENCVELSNELLSRRADLHVDETHKARKWKSFRQALKTVWSKKNIDDISGRLRACKDELNLHLIMVIKYVSPDSAPLGFVLQISPITCLKQE